MMGSLLPASVTVVHLKGDDHEAELLPAEADALPAVSPRRRREFALARTCARRALATLGVPAVPILTGPEREPLWPPGVVGSITHCSGYCAAALALKGEVASLGIDAELHDELPRGVLGMVTRGQEREWLLDLPDTGVCWDRLLFSAKESIYKAWFPLSRSWLGFADVLMSIDPRTASFRGRLLGPGPVVGNRSVTAMEGRYLVDEHWILTAVTVLHEP
jgi:4'-phosphopantetheinyl transferase EntD